MKKLFWLIGVLVLALMMKAQEPEKTAGSNPRTFFLLFQTLECDDKISHAVDSFFTQVFRPGDWTAVIIHGKRYNLDFAVSSQKTTEAIAEEVKSLIRHDSPMGAANFQSIFDQMKSAVIEIRDNLNPMNDSISRDVQSIIRVSLTNYRQLLNNLSGNRTIGEPLLLQLAAETKAREGEKYLVVFYHQEMVPIPNRRYLEILQKDISLGFDAMELFQSESTKDLGDVKKISQEFSSSKIKLYLAYIPRTVEKGSGYELRDRSLDVFNFISKIVKKSGGTTETTIKPELIFQKISL